MSNVSDDRAYYHHVVQALHKFDTPNPWIPHPSQLLIGQAVFVNNCKSVFVQCGRKFGKTEIVIYCLWRWALLNPGSSCFYICPEGKQAKEVIWEAKDRRGGERLQTFVGPEFIQHIDNDEMRITLPNNSSIKVDGSNNFSAWRGLSPHFIVLDEFADFKPEFYDAMNPNRATYDAPMIIIGTPPKKLWVDAETPHQYIQIAEEYRDEMVSGKDAFWIKRPSWSNPDPVIQRFLAEEKKRLFKAGKEDVWFREYGAELVPEKAKKIFPGFTADYNLEGSHVMQHGRMIEVISN